MEHRTLNPGQGFAVAVHPYEGNRARITFAWNITESEVPGDTLSLLKQRFSFWSRITELGAAQARKGQAP